MRDCKQLQRKTEELAVMVCCDVPGIENFR